MSDDIIGQKPKLPTLASPHRPSTSILMATSAAIDRRGETYVVLYWTPHESAIGYNLYRSEDGVIPGRAHPLNGNTPISPVSTCSALQAIIPPGSPEWMQLTKGFTALRSRNQLEYVSDTQHRAYFKDRSVLQGLRGDVTLNLPHSALLPWEIDPCDALARGLSQEEEALFDTFANYNLRFRLARGLAYQDTTVVADRRYFYELRAVMPDDSEVVLSSGVQVWSGHFTLPDPPSGLKITAGDSKILALWNRNPYAFSYRVRRSQYPTIGYQLIHAEPIRLEITQDLYGKLLPTPQPGFVDFQRWDDNGLPKDHDVNGVMVSGPQNGVTYYYQVAGVDILGREGNWSLAEQATPVCSTAPMAPSDLRVDPNTNPLGLALSWHKVTCNVENHQIQETIQSYEIYRGSTQSELEDVTGLAAHQITTLIADPTDLSTPTLSWIDTDPMLAPAFGEKDFWYRVRCIDQHGSVSAPSAMISGRIPDITPPGSTDPDGAEGHADHIRIFWKPNSELDLAGYQIYRGICDHGLLYQPKQDREQVPGCGMILVGSVSCGEAKTRIAEVGRPYFDDYSVPPGSPLCYAYWVRAYDAAQNLYQGINGCPSKREEYICQRLYEETPPSAPVITALQARNNAVLIEWIAEPVQDLRAFHVYRSDQEYAPLQFVICVFSDGTRSQQPWTGIKPSCADIPAEPNPTSVHGSFLHTNVEPNRVYWYRVSALDWLGNESEGTDLTRLPAISTFTYSSELPLTPVLLAPPTPSEGACGLEVCWNPVFDPQVLSGYIVFRSDQPVGSYRQVSPIVTGNTFTDMSARRGVDYWYRVQAIDTAGRLSQPSWSLKHRY